MNHTMSFAALTLAACMIGGTAEAQHTRKTRGGDAADRTLGLSLGAYTMGAPGVSVSGADIDGKFGTGFGPGAGVMVGYGFNRTFSSYVSLDLAKQQTTPDSYPNGSFGLAHLEIGTRANLPMKSRTTVPYVTAAFGRRALGAQVTDEDTGEHFHVTLSGHMFALGGGVEHFISPSMAVDAGASLGLGSFDHYEDDGDQSTLAVNQSHSIRLRVGLTWRPQGR